MLRRPTVWILLVTLATVVAWAARKPGDPLKPGFNLFSRAQDIEVGKANAKQVEEQYPIAKNAFLQDYVKRVGSRLANAPEAAKSEFPFTFTVLHVEQVNAFALPGGPMFIFSRLMRECDSEGQLAGVMGHEMAHVILRHGTNQATKANFASLALGAVGSLIGENSTSAQLANLSLNLGAGSYLLKFSRDAESEADALGSHLMADAGYDPVEMARFFEKLNGSGSSNGLQFFSDHPNPGNRERAIRAEMQTLRPRPYNYQTGDFNRMKSEVAALGPGKK